MLIISSTHAQGPLIFIEPINPSTGDSIRAGVKVNHCDTMPYENPQGLTHLLNINDANIELNTIALVPILPGGIPCVPPNQIAYYELGVLDEGDYTLAVWVYGQFTTFPFPSGFGPPPPYDIINFSVSAAPVSVPSNSVLGLLFIFVVLISIGIYRIKKTKS